MWFKEQLLKFASQLALYFLGNYTHRLIEGMLNNEENISKKNIKNMEKRLRRRINTTRHEDIIATHMVCPDDIDVTFESIGGLETKKKELHELSILPLSRPELFSHGKLSAPHKGILLYGPPGNGKSMLAKAIAKESGASLINLNMSTLVGKYVHDIEQTTAAIFSLAYKVQPSIIFIDEIDKLFQWEVMESDILKRQFMASWDCQISTKPKSRILVIAATNHPTVLDEAMLQRFVEAFEIGMPGHKDRVEILMKVLEGEKVDKSIDFDRVASLCGGYSGSDLFDLCKKAMKYPIRDFVNCEKSGDGSQCDEPRALCQDDLERVVESWITTSVAVQQYNVLGPKLLSYYT